MNTTNVWLSHRKIKKEFIEDHGIITSLPVIEWLLAAEKVLEHKISFDALDVWDYLASVNAQKSEGTIYRTAKYLREKRYIDPIHRGRQWFCRYKYTMTPQGMVLTQSFHSFVKRYLK